ncbi:MAG TPA: hypothetical protein VLG67_03545 [Candidatus Saccharimonadales bacterium]|nr:hypothetical protein [Candidatus Saccharimonadales bacterium]
MVNSSDQESEKRLRKAYEGFANPANREALEVIATRVWVNRDKLEAANGTGNIGRVRQGIIDEIFTVGRNRADKTKLPFLITTDKRRTGPIVNYLTLIARLHSESDRVKVEEINKNIGKMLENNLDRKANLPLIEARKIFEGFVKQITSLRPPAGIPNHGESVRPSPPGARR